MRYTRCMDTTRSRYEIATRSDRLEVRGVSQDDMTEALELLGRVRSVQATYVAAHRDDLLHALMLANVSLTPPASLAQAQRPATHRDALLATPVLTHDTL